MFQSQKGLTIKKLGNNAMRHEPYDGVMYHENRTPLGKRPIAKF